MTDVLQLRGTFECRLILPGARTEVGNRHITFKSSILLSARVVRDE